MAVNNKNLTKEEKQELKRIETIKSNIDEATIKVNTLMNKYLNSFIIIQDKNTFISYIDKCISNNEVAIDTETTGLNVYRDKIVGLCIYTEGEKEAYVPINHVNYIDQNRLDNQLSEEFIASQLNRLNNTQIIMHNADFDIRVLRKIGANLTCTWDTLIMANLLNENEGHGLKELHSKYCLKGVEDEFSFGKLFSYKGTTFADIPINIAAVYAAHDAKITKELKDFQFSVISRENRPDLAEVYNLFNTIEMPCVDALVNMEDIGFAFNYDYHKILSEKYHTLLNTEKNNLYKELNKYKNEIVKWRLTDDANYKEPKLEKDGSIKYDKKGNIEYKKSKNEQLPDEINLASPTQLAIILYDIMKIKPPDPSSPRGTGEEILKKINNDFTNMLLKFRHFSKLVDAFIDSLPNNVEADGKIHCSLNQYGAKTGRMSCSNPNLQQIPSNNDEIRRLFMAPTYYRDVESIDNKLIFKNTEEIEVSKDNWKFVKDLNIGDLIQDKKIIQINNNLQEIEIIIE